MQLLLRRKETSHYKITTNPINQHQPQKSTSPRKTWLSKKRQRNKSLPLFQHESRQNSHVPYPYWKRTQMKHCIIKRDDIQAPQGHKSHSICLRQEPRWLSFGRLSNNLAWEVEQNLTNKEFGVIAISNMYRKIEGTRIDMQLILVHKHLKLQKAMANAHWG